MHVVVADLKLPDIEKAIKDLSRHANGDQKIVPFPMDCARSHKADTPTPNFQLIIINTI